MRGEDASLLHCACAPSRCACAIGCPLLRGAWWDSTRRCGAFIFPHRGVGVIIFGNEACGLHAVRWYGSSSKHAGTCSRLVGLAAYVLDWTPEEVDGEFPVHNIYEIHVERGGGRKDGLGLRPAARTAQPVGHPSGDSALGPGRRSEREPHQQVLPDEAGAAPCRVRDLAQGPVR